MKLLNEVHVSEIINEVQLEDFFGTILLKDQIAFSDEDFPIDGRSHNKALYIAIKYWVKRYHVCWSIMVSYLIYVH